MKKFAILLLFFVSTIISTTLFTSSANAISVTATSGSAAAIQAAVDQIAAAGGGDVHIPEGTWNFYEIGETWQTVIVPPGVNIFGAPTQRDADDQVVEWKTVLVMPYEAPDSSTWFQVLLDDDDYDPARTNRFSDLRMVGWRYFNQSSTTMYTGIRIYMSDWATYPTEGITDFRVDHCDFQDIAGSAIWLGPYYADWNRRTMSGVIDHCRLVNSYGDPGVGGSSAYEARTLGYGIGMRRANSDFWESDTSQVVGGYHNYTIVIEDNYFSKWRHCTASNDGIHYVFRNNIIEGDYGYGSVDAHGSYATDDRPYMVGTRATEVYNNVFKDPDNTWWSMSLAVNLRGGSGIIYNNTLEGYDYLVRMFNDWGMPKVPFSRVNETYVWSNDLGGGNLILWPTSDIVENEHYFLRQPSTADDGWEYTPYTYPHPLTLDGTGPMTHSLTGTLLDDNSQPVQSEITIYVQGTQTAVTSQQTDSAGNYALDAVPGVYDINFKILRQDFYIPNFFIRMDTFNISSDMSGPLRRITDYPTDHKVSVVADINDTQTIQTHSPDKPSRVSVNGTSLTEVLQLSDLTENKWYYDASVQMLHIIVSPGNILPSRFNDFHSGRGILGVLDGSYGRANILYNRMQLSAEINNSATEPSTILVPSGGYYDAVGHMTITDDSWSEGGVDFDNLKRNLAYCWDNEYVPVMALWVTNIDPIADRNYAMDNTDDIPPQPMASETGYIKFMTYLKDWMYANGYENEVIIWEPCWEFNLWPWTDWGGAGTGRYWALKPQNYYNAMQSIINAKDTTDFNNLIVASHIVSWSADEWYSRGKQRIDGTQGGSDTAWYLEGMKLADVWGISLYGEWDVDWNGNDMSTLGTEGYVDWKFEKIIRQCANDPDIGDKFIGTFEYNMPWQIYDLRTDELPQYTDEELDQMATQYINYTYSKIPENLNNIRMLGWWVPFGSDRQWDSWRHWSAYYDSYSP